MDRGGSATASCAARKSAAGTDLIRSGVVPSTPKNRAAMLAACAWSFTWSPPLDSAARRIRPLVSGEASRLVTDLPPAGQPVHGDLPRVAAERRDVVPGPAQRRDLVVQAERPGRPLTGDVEEAERAKPVVEGDHDQAVAPRERRAVAGLVGTVAHLEAAAVDPQQHRPAPRRVPAPAGAVTFRYRQSSAIGGCGGPGETVGEVRLQRPVPVPEGVPGAAPRRAAAAAAAAGARRPAAPRRGCPARPGCRRRSRRRAPSRRRSA